MVEQDHPHLSITQQCDLLSISRSSFYYEPKGETAMNLALMRLIDEQFLETPFYGVRQMTWHLRAGGHLVNEKRIRRLMRLPDSGRYSRGTTWSRTRQPSLVQYDRSVSQALAPDRGKAILQLIHSNIRTTR